MIQDYQRLLASAPARRLNTAKLAADAGVLKNKLVDTIAFLENLAVKDSSEKDTFFKRLPAAVPQLPLPVAQLKLLPMLAGLDVLSVAQLQLLLVPTCLQDVLLVKLIQDSRANQ